MPDQAWVFRVASSPASGGGHVMRTLSLAQAMARRKPAIQIAFFLDPDGGGWMDQITALGFQAVVDRDQGLPNCHGLVIDSYTFRDDVVQSYKATVGTAGITYIHDVGPIFSAVDLVVNTGAHLSGDALDARPALLGADYALLAKDYRSVNPIPIAETVTSLLISFGRVDSKNATGFSLDALEAIDAAADLDRIDLVLGGGAPNLKAVQAQIASSRLPISLHIDTAQMPALLAGSDMVIGAGGVSLYERCALGCPSVTIAIAENQIAPAEAVGAAGATLYAGVVDAVEQADFVELVSRCLSDQGCRRSLAATARSLIDGCGADRVAETLLNFSVAA